MKIEWNQVTRLSQLIAIVLFVAVYGVGFWVGMTYEAKKVAISKENDAKAAESLQGLADNHEMIADVTYACDSDKTVRAMYYQSAVELVLADGQHLVLPHALSADGARYATADDSYVFWNKGTTAFMTEGAATTLANCKEVPQPQ